MIAFDLTVTGTATIFVASVKERGGITAARKGRKTGMILIGHYSALVINWSLIGHYMYMYINDEIQSADQMRNYLCEKNKTSFGLKMNFDVLLAPYSRWNMLSNVTCHHSNAFCTTTCTRREYC